MVITPTKNANTSITQPITPVRFLDSPKHLKLDANSSLAVCKSRLDTITKTLQDNYVKWQLAQKRGLTLCNNIEAVKTRCLEALNKVGAKDETATLYPKELQPYCDKLNIITNIFEDITTNAKESLKQLRALAKMKEVATEIFYRTWHLAEFIEFTEQLLLCYERETYVKQHIMRELAHCMSRADLIRWTTAWEYPQHVDAATSLALSFLKEETSIDKF